MQSVEDGNTIGADHYRLAVQGERLGAQLGGSRSDSHSSAG
jgi:hypothetical protein